MQSYGFHWWQFHASRWSFPSGHATTIVSVMGLACYVFPRFKAFFIALALLVVASRLVVNMHYLSDVIAGSYIGLLVASLLGEKYGLLLLASQYFNLMKPLAEKSS
jgi:membrane-associated phospholipid phosphatase